jgi:hypothetical protein
VISFMIGNITANALVLAALLYLIAKHEADYSYAKVMMVTAVIGLGSFVIQAFLFEKLGWFSMILVFAMATAMIMIFCWTTLWKTMLVVVLFCIIHVGLKIGFAMLQQMLIPSAADSAVDAPTAAETAAEAATPPATQTNKPSFLARITSRVKASGSPGKSKYSTWEEAKEALVLSATASNNRGGYAAMVNGEMLEVGDVVSVPDGTNVYRWRVQSISKHVIEYEQLSLDTR